MHQKSQKMAKKYDLYIFKYFWQYLSNSLHLIRSLKLDYSIGQGLQWCRCLVFIQGFWPNGSSTVSKEWLFQCKGTIYIYFDFWASAFGSFCYASWDSLRVPHCQWQYTVFFMEQVSMHEDKWNSIYSDRLCPLQRPFI